MAAIPRLEELCITTYLSYLEHEAAAYVQLTQSNSKLLRSIAGKMVTALKTQISKQVGSKGVTSTALRQRMLEMVLSERFPSPAYSNIYLHKRTAKDVMAEAPEVFGVPQQQNIIACHSDFVEETEHMYSNCLNSCCTGSFIKETMAGIIMSHEIKELIFTNDTVTCRKTASFPNCHEFDSPVVLTHLLSSTHQQFSQLEKLVFSEHFVKEEPSATSGLTPGDEEAMTRLRLLQHQHPARILESQRRRQSRFVRQFASSAGGTLNSVNNLYTSSDRRGLVLNLLVMFRDIAPKLNDSIGFYKLTVLVLKNNIQCELYSKANFQFELLARIGFCCPRLKVLDIFGTDTWADCLVALFFRDAFHSLHRYLFFMEDENDEQSAYHPHDLAKYCQFCLDRLHPVTAERPFTVNPIIPLVDPIYDHVIKRYPKRSYCILRNCIRVSDLIQSTQSSVFELMRPEMASVSTPAPTPTTNQCAADSASDNGICSRLRSRKRSAPQQERQPPRKKKSYENLTKCLSSSVSAEEDDTEIVINKAADEIESLHGMMTMHQICRPTDSSHSIGKRRSTRLNSKLSPSTSSQDDKEAFFNRKSKKSPVKDVKNHKTRKEGRTSSTGSNGMDFITFEEWQNETSLAIRSSMGSNSRSSSTNSAMNCPDSNGKMCFGCNAFYTNGMTDEDSAKSSPTDYSCIASRLASDNDWVPPKDIKYREITHWPHLNECIQTLEILNVGGTNVLGEFIPFILLHAKNLKSLGQWINTMIYGLEILRELPGKENLKFPNIQEFSYSTDRNYFCQPYIGFVPETKEYRNVRKEMVKQSARVAKRISHSIRHHDQKQRQILEDVKLMTTSCPNVKKLNFVLHYKMPVIEPEYCTPWQRLRNWTQLKELDLVSMRFVNVQSLLLTIGGQLDYLTLEIDEEQGKGSELVFIAKCCRRLKSLRILIGDKTLMGESNLCYDLPYFRHVEKLIIEGSVHLHAFVFLWGHCRALKFLKMGSVVSNNGTSTNVLVYEVFTLLLQVNKMAFLEELHIKNLKIRSLHMGLLLLDNLPRLQKASNFLLDIYGQDLILFKQKLAFLKQKKGLILDYKEW